MEQHNIGIPEMKIANLFEDIKTLKEVQKISSKRSKTITGKKHKTKKTDSKQIYKKDRNIGLKNNYNFDYVKFHLKRGYI